MINNQMTTGEVIYRGLRLELDAGICKGDLFNKMVEYLLENTDWEGQISKSIQTSEEFIEFLRCYAVANHIIGMQNDWNKYKGQLFALAYMSLLDGDKVKIEKVIERLKNNSHTIVIKSYKKYRGNCLIYPNDMMNFLVIEQDMQDILIEISSDKTPCDESTIMSSAEDMMYYILKLLYEKETNLCEICTEMELEKLLEFDFLGNAPLLRIDMKELMKDREKIEKETPMEILKPDENCQNIMVILVLLGGLLKEFFDPNTLGKYIKKPESTQPE